MKTLLLSPEMAVAWAAGRKTRHTDIMKPQPDGDTGFLHQSKDGTWFERHTAERVYSSRYGKSNHASGDRVRLLTTWAVAKAWDKLKPTKLPHVTDEYFRGRNDLMFWSYFDSPEKPDWCGKLRPGRFLPGFLRHLMPETTILDVRAERVQDISEEDARAEGCSLPKGYEELCMISGGHQAVFEDLWNETHGPCAWHRNDWVWVYTLEGPR